MELRDVPKPSPGAGEVLVRVRAAGLNPVDYKTRQGMLRPIRRYRLPIVAGSDLSGVIEAVGAGVSKFAVGDRVFGRVGMEKLGAFAEFAAASEDLFARMPPALDFVKAGGVPIAGLTVLQALRDELHVARGQRIFISGGAGGVGTFALQLAKWLGAEVATTASPRGAALVRRLGAEVVVDYTRERFEEVLHDYDGALDLVGGETLMKTFRVVKRGVKVVSVAGMPDPSTAKDLDGGALLAAMFWVASFRIRRAARRHGVSYRYLFMHASGAELSELAELIEQGKVRVVIDRVFAFEHIAEAMAYLEQGHAKGKVVVEMAE
jgi:alcohol dehydrogenase